MESRKSEASRLEAEAKVSSARAEVIAAKNKVADEAIVASVVEAINAADEEATGVEVDEVVAEAPAVEETPAVEEAPAAEEAAPAAEEAPAAEASEEAAAE